VNKPHWVVMGCTAALAAAWILAPLPGRGQEKAADAKAKARAEVRAKRDAVNFKNNASAITFYDRNGKNAGTAGERSMYEETVLSPDRTRVAVVKDDLAAQNADLWILDIATGKSIRMTTSAKDEFVQAPVWSPDGSQVAYVEIRSGKEAIYQRASNGEGPEKVVYKNPGAFLNLTDWSADGRFLSFAVSDLSGGVLSVLPLTGSTDPKPIEVFRSKSRLFGPRFSPDGRFLSYTVVNDGARNEIFVRPFNPSGAPSAGGGETQISAGAVGTAYWRGDGKELYYLAPDLTVMVVKVRTTPTFEAEKPKVLFRPPSPAPEFIDAISKDGERFLVLPPARGPQLQQVTVFDRAGKIVSKVGTPGVYGQPAFSPDGTRLVVMRRDIEKAMTDIWIFNIATGKGTQLTNDLQPRNTPMWSPDGKYIFYVSNRPPYTSIYRKPSDGTGNEELMFRYTPGASIGLTDISPDGKFLACGSGGVLLTVALTGSDQLARKAIEFSREEFNVGAGRFSPDGRFLAYVSNEADPDPVLGRNEVYVRSFDPSTGTAGEGKWQLSKNGAAGMELWRGDGKEFFFRQFVEPGAEDLIVMAGDVSTTPVFSAATPKALFTLPGPLGGNFGNISKDGQHFVFAINVPAGKATK
jgi:Tol biopolymer transport system component